MVKVERFLLDFFAVFVVLYVFFHVVDFFFMKDFIAATSFHILRALGEPAVIDGLTVTLGRTSFTIIASCTGVVSFSIFSGLIYATPMKNKVFYMVTSFPLFVAWNVFRVVASLTLGQASPYLLHDFLWMVSVAIILSLYLVVLRGENIYLADEKKPGKPKTRKKRKSKK